MTTEKMPTTRDEFIEAMAEYCRERIAAERRATVERIRHHVLFFRNRGVPTEKIRLTELLAILDEEAAR